MRLRLGDTTLFGFLVTTVAISLSGVMAPGPITAATLAAGTRSRHAGVLIALGHLVVELPLILLLVAGIGKFLQASGTRVGIGLAGGAFLLLMGVQLLLSLWATDNAPAGPTQRHPFWSGVVLTAAQPLFPVVVGHGGTDVGKSSDGVRPASPGVVCPGLLAVRFDLAGGALAGRLQGHGGVLPAEPEDRIRRLRCLVTWLWSEVRLGCGRDHCWMNVGLTAAEGGWKGDHR